MDGLGGNEEGVGDGSNLFNSWYKSRVKYEV
jgi:hypothetical protein